MCSRWTIVKTKIGYIFFFLASSIVTVLVIVGCKGDIVNIHDSADKGDYQTVKFLIERGIDVNLRNKFGETPLHRVAAGFVVKGRAKYPPRNPGYLRTAEILISNGADINARNISGYSPLHKSAMSNRANICKLLICKLSHFLGG